ncbi:T9SS type A sorting domain-containing protein [Mariniflexile sp. AS56]|uniref:T9SS type A sorting domain-containing protein n=1 Tax=Mariniflexile sp. AS56 TaxID=3063957 RepID=UPI0026EF11A3|nr:T9SS type A sorting domain-containing protein [Mariniflexile sp. AS56]MDO7173100.1 T9SS type A sorting domain-containing protein [Mariniflexile sp. AS56]
MKKIYSTILFVFALVAITKAQTTLTAGDIAIVGYKSINTNQGAIAFIILKDIDAGTVIDISNRSWLADQTGFTGSYGVDDVYTWTATNAIPSGTILTLGTGEVVTRVTGGASTSVGTTVKQSPGGTTAGFNLLSNNASNGDSVLFFQHSGAFDEPTDGASAGWITGIKTGIDWAEVKAGTANAFCAKPTALDGADLTILFPFGAGTTMQNGVYNGQLLGSASALRASISNIANWTTSSLNANDGGAHIYKLWSYAESDGTDNGQIGSSGTLSTTTNTAFEFSTYPNPAKDVLYINTKEPLQKVEVYDLLGKNVLSVKNNTEHINVSSLNKSLYILKLTSANGVSTKKFIKE